MHQETNSREEKPQGQKEKDPGLGTIQSQGPTPRLHPDLGPRPKTNQDL